MIPDSALEKLVIGVLTAIVSWLSWVTVRMIKHPDREEVVAMIHTHSPYVQDRIDIAHRLKALQIICDKLDSHMDAQTDDIHHVKAELNKLIGILNERERRRKT